MRAIWRGSISFGLVTIPVKLYTATEDKTVRFRQLHRACSSPIRYVHYCPVCQKEITSDEIVRGYETAPDQFVLFEDEELDELVGENDRTINILDFVALQEVDPIYFIKSYYLEPNEGGHKAYTLLLQAMQETNRTAIATLTLRRKESLAAIRVFDRAVLSLVTLHYPDEIRDYESLGALQRGTGIGAREMDIARELIEKLSVPFQPEQYHDKHREEVLRLIEAKAEGKEMVTAPAARQPQIFDLMEALQASVQKLEEKGRPSVNGTKERKREPSLR